MNKFKFPFIRSATGVIVDDMNTNHPEKMKKYSPVIIAFLVIVSVLLVLLSVYFYNRI